MMVASIPPDSGRIKAQGCAISRGSAVMAVTANRLRIGHPNFVKAVLRNLHTSSRSARSTSSLPSRSLNMIAPSRGI